MIIKTITCHDVYNYGASLQAYALQAFLEKHGHDVKIIDYLPIYRPRRYSFFHLNSKNGRMKKIISLFPFMEPVCALWRKRKAIKFYQRKKKFDYFKNNQLKLTEVSYYNLNELTCDKPEADLYIAGSDQIWNSLYDNGRDAAYYCTFEENPQKCISYAASFGADHIYPGYENFVKKELHNFKSISVRELSGKKIVDKLGYNATVVLDPVFLLDDKDWISLCKVDRTDDYILLYDFLQNDTNVKAFTLKIAKEQNLKIYSLNDFKICEYADLNINNAGPIEFIEYIRGARLVISTSFHATAFCVIFEKFFYTFPLKGHDNSSRMTDFLHLLNLENRFIVDFPNDKCDQIDWEIINGRCRELRMKSQKWLLTNVEN